jgi:hypothetical protein
VEGVWSKGLRFELRLVIVTGTRYGSWYIGSSWEECYGSAARQQRGSGSGSARILDANGSRRVRGACHCVVHDGLAGACSRQQAKGPLAVASKHDVPESASRSRSWSSTSRLSEPVFPESDFPESNDIPESDLPEPNVPEPDISEHGARSPRQALAEASAKAPSAHASTADADEAKAPEAAKPQKVGGTTRWVAC